MPDRIIYLHGFNSSPDSEKAQLFTRYFNQQAKAGLDLLVPELSYDPQQAIALLEELIEEVGECYLVGSSLGGYYASYLSEKYNLLAALVNPAVSPTKTLSAAFLGSHTNSYTSEEYELTMAHVDYLSTLEADVLQYPENFLLLVQTGDEVLDYHLALKRYAGAKQIVQNGGNHGFVGFDAVLPEIFSFAKLLE